MPASDTHQTSTSARALTFAAYISFVPVGIATVILGPLLPTLSARWSLNYAQSGALFNAQYFASTLAVAISGVLVARRGYRFAMNSGLLLAAAGIGLLLSGSKILGIACIAANGAGLGLSVPAANLLAAEVNPGRRSAVLNVLNFCWSIGAVSCPFLVALAARRQHITFFLGAVAAFEALVVVGIMAMPARIVEPDVAKNPPGSKSLGIDWKHPAMLSLGILFLLYVGTENGFGLWLASYAKSLGTLTPTIAVMTPSFFYAALTIGRWIAPFALRSVDEVRWAQLGLVVSCVGMSGLMMSHALLGVSISTCVAGLGISSVYPITIALLSREFGASASRVGSLMFTLSNLGGGLLPWFVGVSSNRFGTLKAGLAVPLIGSAAMLLLYFRNWKPDAVEQVA